MKLTLTDTGRTGRASLNGTPVTYRQYEVVEKRIVELHGQFVRPHIVTVYSNGEVAVFLIFVTKRGVDFKMGHGYRLSLANMRQRNTLPQAREAIAEALKALCRIDVMDVQVGDREAYDQVMAVRIEDSEDGSRRIIHWSDGETTLVNVQYPFSIGILPRTTKSG
jgi:hypothetical protein